jgi:hypothetical protein
MRHKVIRLAGLLALAAVPVSSQAVAQAVTAAATSIPFITLQPQS